MKKIKPVYKNQNGFSLLELLGALLIVLAVFYAGAIGLRTIAKGGASLAKKDRSEIALKDAFEALRGAAKEKATFEDDSQFSGCYYFPPFTKPAACPVDIDTVADEEFRKAPVKIIFDVKKIDIYNKTREVTATAIWKEGSHTEKKSLTYLLSLNRPNTLGGSVTGRIIDGKKFVDSGQIIGVKDVVVFSKGQLDDRDVFTRTNKEGEFILHGVKEGAGEVTVDGTGANPHHYFRGINNTWGDEWEHANSEVIRKFNVNILVDAIAKIDDPYTHIFTPANPEEYLLMWPYGSLKGSVKRYGDKAPPGNIIVELVQFRTEIFGKYGVFPPGATRTGANGEFEFKNLCPGNYHLFIHGTGEDNTYPEKKESDNYQFTQVPNLRNMHKREEYNNAPSVAYSAVAITDDFNLGRENPSTTMLLKEDINYIRIEPGETYDSADGNHNGKHPHDHRVGVNKVPKDVNHLGTHNAPLNTHHFTAAQGHFTGTISEAEWDESGKRFQPVGLAGADVEIITRKSPTTVYPAALPASIPGAPGYPNKPEPFNMSNTRAWNPAHAEEYADDSKGAFVRHNNELMRIAKTNGSGKFSFNNFAMPIAYGPHSSMFNQVSHTEVYTSSPVGNLAPVMIIPAKSGEGPNRSYRFVLYLGADGGKGLGDDEYGYDRDYVVLPSKLVWETWPVHPPNNTFSGYENWDEGPDQADLIEPFLIGHAGLDKQIMFLKRDQMANVKGNIKNADRTPFTTAAGIVFTIGMETADNTKTGQAYINLSYTKNTVKTETSHTYDLMGSGLGGNDENCALYDCRVLPSIPTWADGFGNGNGYGNERIIFFRGNKGADGGRFTFHGRLRPLKRTRMDTTGRRHRPAEFTHSHKEPKVEATIYQTVGEVGTRKWKLSQIDHDSDPDGDGIYEFQTHNTEKADMHLFYWGQSEPLKLEPGKQREDGSTDITVSEGGKPKYETLFLRVPYYENESNNTPNSEWFDATAFSPAKIKDGVPHYRGVPTFPFPDDYADRTPPQEPKPDGYKYRVGGQFDGETVIEIRKVQKAAKIHGVVYSPEDNKPVAGAKVLLKKSRFLTPLSPNNASKRWTIVDEVETDENGAFIFEHGDSGHDLSFVFFVNPDGSAGHDFNLKFIPPEGKKGVWSETNTNRYSYGDDDLVWKQDFTFSLGKYDPGGKGF